MTTDREDLMLHSGSRKYTLKDAIVEALSALDGCGNVSDVRNYIHTKYGERWKDIGTAMADLCPESKSSMYPMKERVLRRVGRGKYCLRDLKSTSVIESIDISLQEKPKLASSKLSTYSFKQAEVLLQEKGQLSTILQAAKLTDLSSKADHDKIQQFFIREGWETEISKFPILNYRLDAYKDRTGVEIERSLIDAIHRSFFRCTWAYTRNLLDVLVFIIPTYKEPKFETVKRDIMAFKEIIPYPVLIIGVSR